MQTSLQEPSNINKVTRLLTLKRYEQPPQEYFERFLIILRAKLDHPDKEVDHHEQKT